MAIRQGDVVVRQLPATFSGKQGRRFIREIRVCADIDRPRMVLDCSNVHYLDKSMVILMLCCLEEAMKRHGDVRLAAMRAPVRALLEATGVSRLFEIYDTAAEAVKGFHQFPAGSILQAPASDRPRQLSENAA